MLDSSLPLRVWSWFLCQAMIFLQNFPWFALQWSFWQSLLQYSAWLHWVHFFRHPVCFSGSKQFQHTVLDLPGPQRGSPATISLKSALQAGAACLVLSPSPDLAFDVSLFGASWGGFTNLITSAGFVTLGIVWSKGLAAPGGVTGATGSGVGLEVKFLLFFAFQFSYLSLSRLALRSTWRGTGLSIPNLCEKKQLLPVEIKMNL